jgi:hypothetical protein
MGVASRIVKGNLFRDLFFKSTPPRSTIDETDVRLQVLSPRRRLSASPRQPIFILCFLAQASLRLFAPAILSKYPSPSKKEPPGRQLPQLVKSWEDE